VQQFLYSASVGNSEPGNYRDSWMLAAYSFHLYVLAISSISSSHSISPISAMASGKVQELARSSVRNPDINIE
jgi:hypothetical protein